VCVIYLHIHTHTQITSSRLFQVTETYKSSLYELLLAGFAILLLASPGFEGRGLQGTTVREGQGPGPLQGTLVHGIQVECGLLLTLASRQEGDT